MSTPNESTEDTGRPRHTASIRRGLYEGIEAKAKANPTTPENIRARRDKLHVVWADVTRLGHDLDCVQYMGNGDLAEFDRRLEEAMMKAGEVFNELVKIRLGEES